MRRTNYQRDKRQLDLEKKRKKEEKKLKKLERKGLLPAAEGEDAGAEEGGELAPTPDQE